MVNLWLNKTDDFLCNNIRNIFESLEDKYQNKDEKVDIMQELKNLAFDPFVSIKDNATSFEKTLKFQLKKVVGIFFVFIPLGVFLVLFHFIQLEYSYAFVATFIVAMFASIRLDKIATKYYNFRYSLIKS